MNTEGYGYPIFRMNEIHHSLCDLTTEKFVELSNEEFYAVKLNDRDVLFNRTKDETFKTPDEMGRSRNTYELIQQRPLNYFQYHFDVNLTPQRDLSASEKEWFRKLHESRRQNSVLWFLDFVYRLRNALFHEIIDPLDEEWQVIFKNAYLVLKEIVDLNIAAIETR